MKPWVRVSIVALFAVGMAYVESMVVVYLREILSIVPTPVNLDPRFFERAVSEHPELVWREQTREAATVVMIVTLAVLAGRRWRERLGVFLLAFGVWDLFYYLWLYVLIGWPPSLMTKDVLFLIPVAWIAPVLLPTTIAACMVAAGCWCLFSNGRRTDVACESAVQASESSEPQGR